MADHGKEYEEKTVRVALAEAHARIKELEELAWERVASTRIPFRCCRICRGVDPRCTEMIADSRVTNVGHQPKCPYLPR